MLDLAFYTDEQIAHIRTPAAMAAILKSQGCHRCNLGTQEGLKAPVVYRGEPEALMAIFGEGPGEDEDREGDPFVGKAGKLLDRILNSVGLSSEEDFYIGNVIKCRPIAPVGSGKKNLTPTVASLRACAPFWRRELELVRPRLLILAGKIAAQTVLGTVEPLTNLVGDLQPFEASWGECQRLVIYHPAAILHAEPFPDKKAQLKAAMWLHARMIRNWLDFRLKREPQYPEIIPNTQERTSSGRK